MASELPWTRRLWHQWKALRTVPFRRKWFVGYDLEGNSYWEFIDRNNPWRPRRKVEYGSKTMHISDYRGPPQWVQWLRHARPHAPTIEELLQDQQRQVRLRFLAQQADQRWQQVPTIDRPHVAVSGGVPGTDAATAPGAWAQAAVNEIQAREKQKARMAKEAADGDAKTQDARPNAQPGACDKTDPRKGPGASQSPENLAGSARPADPARPADTRPARPARPARPTRAANPVSQTLADDDRTAAVFKPVGRR